VNQPYPFLLPRRYWELRSQLGSLSRNVRNCPDANFDGMFRSLCRQAGIERGERDFHDLRKTFVTNLSRVPGLAPQDIQSLARHASIKTTMRYMAVSPVAAQIAEQHSIV
jgi:integrase